MQETIRNVVSADVESFSDQRHFHLGVNLFRVFADEEGGLGVDLYQVSPAQSIRKEISEFASTLLEVGVHENVKTQNTEVVVKAADILLHNFIDVLMSTKNGLDDDILDVIPERLWISAMLPQPGPQLSY